MATAGTRITRHDFGHLLRCVEVVVTEPVVVAQDQRRHAEAGDQIIADKGLGGQAAEFPGERQDLETVHAAGQAALLLLLQRRQQPEPVGILLQDAARMRPEGHDHALLPPLTGDGAQLIDHLPVPQMYAVEKTGRRYSHFTSSKSCRCGRSGFLA